MTRSCLAEERAASLSCSSCRVTAASSRNSTLLIDLLVEGHAPSTRTCVWATASRISHDLDLAWLVFWPAVKPLQLRRHQAFMSMFSIRTITKDQQPVCLISSSITWRQVQNARPQSTACTMNATWWAGLRLRMLMMHPQHRIGRGREHRGWCLLTCLRRRRL